MYAVSTSHIPSCDPFPPRGRLGPRSWLPLVAAVLLLPSPAALAQELRARDLSVIEDQLAVGVQEAIQSTVQAVNLENLQAQEMSVEAGETPQLRFVFRSTGSTQARGMFLQDYGVIFTVQVPYMTYAPSARIAVGGPSSYTIIGPNSADGMVATVLGEEMQLRAQMSRMRAEIDQFTNRLAQEVEESGATSENARRLRASIAEIESAYNAYAAEEAERVAAARDAKAPRGDQQSAGAATDPRRFSTLWMLNAAEPEDIARAEELARQQKTQIEGAIIEAVVDTLARYGRVIRSLEEGDRLAVVLLPSSYLSQIGSWSRATQRDEEFIISVRYRDILELDQDNITAEEFGGRIRVESRLGQPHQRH